MRIAFFWSLCLLTISAEAASPIGQVLSCGKEGIIGGLGAGSDMKRFTVDTKRFAIAAYLLGPASRSRYDPSS